MMNGRSISIGVVLLSLAAMVSSCGGGGGGGGSTSNSGGGGTTTRQWTYMVYMGADNNLAQGGLIDLNEMESVGSTAAVSIVLQAEFSSRYVPGVPTNTLRFHVQKDNDPNSVNLGSGTSIGNVNMADPATLTAFIQWAKNTYPAQHYALVIWDHGSGWKDRLASTIPGVLRGAVQDETSGSFMTLPQLAQAVNASGVHFDVINFDACLMAMYEVAYQFRGLTDYMTFSEQTEPGEGDPFDTILAALVSNPTMTGQTLATTIVDRFDQFYAANPRGSTTKSAVNMSALATLDTNLLALASALVSDPIGTIVLTSAATGTATQSYAYPANHDIWDLSDYLASSAAGTAVKSAAGAVKTAVSSIVISSRFTGSAEVGRSHGMAIYLPLSSETNTAEMADYAALASSQARVPAATTWRDLVSSVIGLGGGSATFGQGNFGLYLTWTNMSDQPCDADLDLYVGEPGPKLYAPYMGQTTPNGFFSADSSASGKSEEFYLANDQVQTGAYFFLVNMFSAGTCTTAKAHLFYYNPGFFGDSNWHEATSAELGVSLTYPSPTALDLSSPWNGDTSGLTSLADLNNYSDWWVPFSITRTIRPVPFFSGAPLPPLTKDIQLIIRYKKGLQSLGRLR